MIVDPEEYEKGEDARRRIMAEVKREATERPTLERRHGKVWSSDELRAEFEVLGFMEPYVNVRRRSDQKVGSLEFQREPRFYWDWKEHE